jgi:hypothetical protein
MVKRIQMHQGPAQNALLLLLSVLATRQAQQLLLLLHCSW